MKSIILSTIICFGVFTACKSGVNKNTSQVEAKSQSSTRDQKLLQAGYTYGVITDKTGLDGCTFVIYGDSSRAFEPYNLEEEYKKDGLKIYFKYRLSRAPSICQHGQPIILSEIKSAK